MWSRRTWIAIFCTVALILQATVGFALSIQCLVDCSRPAPVPTTGCCQKKQKLPSPEGKHHSDCKGCCGEVSGAKSPVSVGLPQFVGFSLLKLAPVSTPVIALNFDQIDAQKHLFAGDSSPPTSSPPDRISGRAPPVN